MTVSLSEQSLLEGKCSVPLGLIRGCPRKGIHSPHLGYQPGPRPQTLPRKPGTVEPSQPLGLVLALATWSPPLRRSSLTSRPLSEVKSLGRV